MNELEQAIEWWDEELSDEDGEHDIPHIKTLLEAARKYALIKDDIDKLVEALTTVEFQALQTRWSALANAELYCGLMLEEYEKLETASITIKSISEKLGESDE